MPQALSLSVLSGSPQVGDPAQWNLEMCSRFPRYLPLAETNTFAPKGQGQMETTLHTFIGMLVTSDQISIFIPASATLVGGTGSTKMRVVGEAQTLGWKVRDRTDLAESMHKSPP
ncbi:hypothetical protein CMUS01_11519 [Colletotrichum musicola]|uniref:Uncharacterized protein n=1 Tax=Colletotrichum musicola TaxID=2175873 RepID=A0A8H6JX84_9PEZI|nr:hypothetical protein CMUS01_11519 [Colletotrichum musicola]